MAYESLKKTSSSSSPAHHTRENRFAPRPYNPQPEQEKEVTPQPRETYSRDAYDLIAAKVFSTPSPTVQKQPTPQPQAPELEPESEEQQQESEDAVKLQASSNPEQPNNNKHSLNQNTTIQTKLTIGEPGDRYEQEADSVARQVMSINITQPAVQRQDAPPEPETHTKPLSIVQRNFIARTQAAQQTHQKPLVHRESPSLVQRHFINTTKADRKIQKSGQGANQEATPSLESRLISKKGAGSPLDHQTRSFMESRFGSDFRSVRVHTDTTAVQMNKELGAQAFTHGSDIFYGAGKSPGQNELTAHELTHVVQQGGAKPINQQVQPKLQLKTANSNKEIRLFPEPQTLPAKQLTEITDSLINKESTPLQQKIENYPPATTIQTKQLNTGNILQRQPLNISSVGTRIQGNWLAEQAFTKALGSGATQVLSVLKKAGSVFGSIITNPVKFIGNLVAAIRNGFNKFRANIGKHLQNGLTGWLFGALSGAGLVMPAQFDVKGIFSLVLQVLNLTYENVRARLAKKVGGQKVNRLEQSVDVLKKIASGGLVAIWQDIAQYVGNLKDLVIGGIKDWVINTIISQAIAKLISMFTPAGAFIQAVVTIYNTIMFFIERASQIAALANSIFNSIGKIAAGETGAASNYIEQSMARTLPVMISFLARLIGLGGISQKIKDIIKRIQAPVNKAIDKVVDAIVTKGKAVLSGSNNQTQKPQPLGAVGHKPRGSQTQKPPKSTITNQKPQLNTPQKPQKPDSSNQSNQQNNNLSDTNKIKTLKAAVSEAYQLMNASKATVESVKKQLPNIQNKYKLKSIQLVKGNKRLYHIHATINPTLDSSPGVLFTTEELKELEAVAKNFAVQINQKEKEKPGTKAKFLANPEQFIREGKVDKSGDPVEAMGTPALQKLAASYGLTVIINPYIQFIDATGKNIGGKGPELDFLILGSSGLQEIVSAKLKPGKFVPKTDKQLLSHFVNMPLVPPDIVTYAQNNFGKNKAYANIASAKVISNLGEQLLGDFRAKYLSKVVVDQIVIKSLTPGPELPQGYQLRVTEPELLAKVVELVKKYI